MGTPEFAVRSLDALVKANVDVVGVVTAPDKPAGRGRQLQGSAVKARALELGLPLFQPVKLRDPDFHRQLAGLGADLFVVVAFRMLPEAVWNMPRLGTINLHASLLPQYRGAAPINWVVINGETTTGATTFFIRHEIDTGDVLMRETLSIGPNETAGELHDRLAAMGGQLLARTVQHVLDGTIQRQPQQADANVVLRSAPKLAPENCRIDWRHHTTRVHDHIRGLSPYPGAWTEWHQGDRKMHFKVLRTSLASSGPSSSVVPGTVQLDREGMLVACGDGWLRLIEVQLEGKRRMSAADLARGIAVDQSITLR
ncbi:MAG: methionyl-tRNA formyltransferase [Flavobacteriales bacterium]|nr:MAG: methionyl-tRNA formyltransferase [Flavobacteriales bacterium]